MNLAKVTQENYQNEKIQRESMLLKTIDALKEEFSLQTETKAKENEEKLLQLSQNYILEKQRLEKTIEILKENQKEAK